VTQRPFGSFLFNS